MSNLYSNILSYIVQKCINLKEIDDSELPDYCDTLDDLKEAAEDLRGALELELCKNTKNS